MRPLRRPLKSSPSFFSLLVRPLAPALLLLLAACAPVPAAAPMPASPAAAAPRTTPAEDQRAIAAVLDDWHDAADKADEERYFGLLAADSVFLGTDLTERWDKPAFRAYSHPHFAKGKAWSFRSVRRVIVLAPGADAAWFDEDLASSHLGPARGSGALVRLPEGWRITLYNLSIPIPNDRFDAVKKLIDGPPAP